MKRARPDTNLLISKTRQQIQRLADTLSSRLTRILETRHMIKGTIYTQKKRCGNARCKCARGELHCATMLSLSHLGKTRLIPLTKYSEVELMKIRKAVKQYQAFRHNRAEAAGDFKRLIVEINKLERNLLIEVAPKKRG